MRAADEAKRWIGYLEHNHNGLLWVYRANAGKGGYTVFAQIIADEYRWRNFQGMPWCATFVHAVFIAAYGKETARKMLGKPHPGTKVLARRMKRKGRLMGRDYTPKANDLIFLHNGDGQISHVGIVEKVEGNTVITIEGNTVDPSGYFPESSGGAVARRKRKLTDAAIVNYAKIDTEGE
jgi:hypothetical protein